MGTGVAVRIVAWLAVLALAGCSSAPDPEDVITGGALPEDDRWCRLLTAEELAAPLGEEHLDRVLQVGTFVPTGHPSPECAVVRAEGDEAVELVSVGMWFRVGGQPYVDELTRLRDLLGPTGGRLVSGEVEELLPGVYYSGSSENLIVHFACEAPPDGNSDDGEAGAGVGDEQDDDELPTLLRATLSTEPTSSGRPFTPEELTSIGERLVDLTGWVNECAYELRPLGADDWEPLADLYFSLSNPSS